MRLLVDNDVIHKLAAFNLLPIALRCVCGQDGELVVGPRTPFSMFVRKNQAKGQQRFGREVHVRIVAFVSAASVLQEPASDDDLQALTSVGGIDAGEGLLFVAAARDPSALVATGDHRSIEALASATTCSRIVHNLAGRLLIIEQLLLVAIRELGFERVKESVLPGITVDMGIQSWAFGSGQEAKEAVACEGLRARVENLRTRAAGMIHAEVGA